MEIWLKWANPSAFYYLFVVAGVIVLYFYSENRSQQKLFKFFGEQVTKYLSQSISISKRRLQLFLQITGAIFIILALARPQSGESQQEIKSEGVELIILADVSESMLVEDVKPSRLAQMKIELSKLVELLPGHKIGIIAFAGSSSLLSPLTTDPNALRMYIEALDTDSVSSQGTHFEPALTYAEEAFQRGGVTQDDTIRTTRVVLVVSDGEDQEQGALDAAKKLTEKGVRIYTMAYGTEKGGGVPKRDQYGNLNGFKKDKSGQTILSQVKGDFLKSLSESGQGQFYFAYFNGDHLKKFVNDLNNLEKSEFDSKLLTQYEEQYTWPLLCGWIFLFISFLLNDRQNKLPNDWKGRYEVAG